MATLPTPTKLYDALGAFDGGVNEGDSPLDIPPNVMSGSVNTTVRGKFVTHRPAYHNRPITFQNVTGQSTPTQQAVQQGYFQGSCQATDDAGNASLVALISQRLFQFLIQGNVLTCQEIIIPGGAILPNQPQAWLWQSERWVIVNDGLNNPLFLDLNGGTVPVFGTPIFGTARRSNNKATLNFSTSTTSGFTTGIPAVGAIDTLNLTSNANLKINDIVTIGKIGTFQVTSISNNLIGLQNLTATKPGTNFGAGVAVTWSHVGQELPPGRMGAYGLGRNWISLPGGLTFVAGDIERGASGTQAFGFRDAVLSITENDFIVGGGAFSIPASGGETIQAMLFVATLNVALGQGPLQVFTNNRVFSCNAPVDRLTWQSITNPILTVSLISNGAEGQNSTVISNSDPLFRSVDGIRSLSFSQFSFWSPNNLWANVPLSFEVSPTLASDNTALLQWGSSISFDNRRLDTVAPVQVSQGVYFTGLVPINFDTVSPLGKKSAPVWDSAIWTGLNVLQLLAGEVASVQRAFAFCLNSVSSSSGIEVWEILPSNGPLSYTADNNGTQDIPISWQFDSHSMRFGVPPNTHAYMFLSNGEIQVDDLIDTVSFDIQYKPDQYPIWTEWRSWSSSQNSANVTAGNPDFLPRQGLGAPSPAPCDSGTNRPLRNGFTFQTRNNITGHCVFIGAFYEAQTLPMPEFARIICPTPTPMTPAPPTLICGNYGGGPPNFTPSISCMTAIDTSNGAQWNWYGGAWHLVVVSGAQQVFFGTGNPVVVPTATSAFYIDVATPSQPRIFYWANGTWTLFIG